MPCNELNQPPGVKMIVSIAAAPKALSESLRPTAR